MKTEIKHHELNIPEYTQLMSWLEKKAGKDRPTGWSALVYAQYLISQNPKEWWERYHHDLANNFDLSKGSYWCSNGKHQEFADKIHELMPKRGAVVKHLPNTLKDKQSFKPLLECFRVYQNIYYDLYNNGGDNMYEPSQEWDDHYQEEYYEYEWRDYVVDQVEAIDRYLKLPKVKSLKYNFEESVKSDRNDSTSIQPRSHFNYWIERAADSLLEKLKEAYKNENAHLLKRLVGIEE